MISGTVVSPENVDRSVNIPLAGRSVVADKKLRVHEPRLHLIIRRSRFSDRPAGTIRSSPRAARLSRVRNRQAFTGEFS